MLCCCSTSHHTGEMQVKSHTQSGVGAAREKDRNSFFESLRRKDSPAASLPDAGDDAAPEPNSSAPSAPQSPEASAAAAADAAAGHAASSPAQEQPQPSAHALPAEAGVSLAAAPAEAGDTAPAAASGMSNDGGDWGPPMMGNGSCSSADQLGASIGRKAAKLVIPAEEEAFLRSLGWEACDDDEDEGAARAVPGARFILQPQASLDAVHSMC